MRSCCDCGEPSSAGGRGDLRKRPVPARGPGLLRGHYSFLDGQDNKAHLSHGHAIEQRQTQHLTCETLCHRTPSARPFSKCALLIDGHRVRDAGVDATLSEMGGYRVSVPHADGVEEPAILPRRAFSRQGDLGHL